MPQPDSTYLVKCPACGTANSVPASSEGKAGKCGNCGKTLPALYTRPVALTDRSFDSFAESYPGPMLTEFWAPW